MALSSATVWEVRTTGSDTNGGGFVAGITSKSSATDLVVASGSNVQVSSATYGFTSADAGRWISITSGTGWEVGYFQILSVTTGTATLSASPAAVNTTAGHFTVYYGLDYSQQNATNSSGSNISTTDLVTNGTATVTSITATFTADSVGNVVYIAGGTGSITAGWYQIGTFTNSTTVVLDRATGLTAGTGATLNIGGAIATLANLASLMVIQNKAFIKATGTYQTAATVTFSIGNLTIRNQIIGYTSTRGDNGQATLQMITNSGFYGITLGAQGISMYNITVDCNSLGTSGGITCTSNADIVYNCKVKNYTNIGINGGGLNVIGCEVFDGATGATVGINFPGIALYNYVHDGVGSGILSSGVVYGNIVSNMSGATSDGISNQQGVTLHNTVYGSGRHGINNGTNWYGAICLNNILVNNGGFGIVGATAQAPTPVYDGNAFYGNTSGATSNLNNISGQLGSAAYIYVNNVTCTGVPFTNAGSGDFSLNATAGAGAACRNAGVPTSFPGSTTTNAHPDMGAVQHPDPGTITVNPNFAA